MWSRRLPNRAPDPVEFKRCLYEKKIRKTLIQNTHMYNVHPKLTDRIRQHELVNQMQIELRVPVTLLDINVVQTLLGKVKYSTHPL